jgi:hypothetical protein
MQILSRFKIGDSIKYSITLLLIAILVTAINTHSQTESHVWKTTEVGFKQGDKFKYELTEYSYYFPHNSTKRDAKYCYGNWLNCDDIQGPETVRSWQMGAGEKIDIEILSEINMCKDCNTAVFRNSTGDHVTGVSVDTASVDIRIKGREHSRDEFGRLHYRFSDERLTNHLFVFNDPEFLAGVYPTFNQEQYASDEIPNLVYRLKSSDLIINDTSITVQYSFSYKNLVQSAEYQEVSYYELFNRSYSFTYDLETLILNNFYFHYIEAELLTMANAYNSPYIESPKAITVEWNRVMGSDNEDDANFNINYSAISLIFTGFVVRRVIRKKNNKNLGNIN